MNCPICNKCPVCHKEMTSGSRNGDGVIWSWSCAEHGGFNHTYIVGFWTGWFTHRARVLLSLEEEK